MSSTAAEFECRRLLPPACRVSSSSCRPQPEPSFVVIAPPDSDAGVVSPPAEPSRIPAYGTPRVASPAVPGFHTAAHTRGWTESLQPLLRRSPPAAGGDSGATDRAATGREAALRDCAAAGDTGRAGGRFLLPSPTHTP